MAPVVFPFHDFLLFPTPSTCVASLPLFRVSLTLNSFFQFLHLFPVSYSSFFCRLASSLFQLCFSNFLPRPPHRLVRKDTPARELCEMLIFRKIISPWKPAQERVSKGHRVTQFVLGALVFQGTSWDPFMSPFFSLFLISLVFFPLFS